MSPPPAAARPLAGLLVIGLGASLPPLDLAVNVAFPAITAAFDLEMQSIRWVVAAYVLTYASLMLAFGKLGDLVGYRRVFGAGLWLGAAAFVLCALAPDYGWLLAARTVQGVAAALLLSCAPALATSLYEEGRRIWVLGAFSSMAAAAGVLAPLLGGASIAAFGWAGVFWFRAPIALLALLLLSRLPPFPQAPRRASVGGFDFATSSLLAAGLGMLLLAPTLVQSGDTVLPALSAALAGAGLFYLFARRQQGVAEPFLPGAVLRDPRFALINLASIAVHFAGFTVPLLVPYYLTRIAGYGPLESGALLTAWPLGMMVGSALAAPAARRLGTAAAALCGAALVAAGLWAIGLLPSGPAAMLAALPLHGAGVGLFHVAYTDIVIARLPRRDRGVAGSLTILTRTIGILIAAAALSGAMHAIESGALATGAGSDEAFVHALRSVFQFTALAFSAFFALALLRLRPASSD